MKKIFFSLGGLLFISSMFYSTISIKGNVLQPRQNDEGPGGSAYIHNDVIMIDEADEEDGYYLFIPDQEDQADASVVVFVHGYSAINPMVYGHFIKHLVRKGNIVIFPRYQKNMFSPKPEQFVPNTVTAIKNASIQLKEEYQKEVDDLYLIGHSFGGVIIPNMILDWEKHGIAQPKGAMLVSPGTGPIEGIAKESYENLPEDLSLLVIVSDNDQVVGDIFGKTVFNTAIKTNQRNLLRQFSDDHGTPVITDDHLEIYCKLDKFDSGDHGYSFQRAKNSVVDAIDYNGYWKLFDALMACRKEGEHCQYAFGNTEEQTNLGNWSDGSKIRSLIALTPTE